MIACGVRNPVQGTTDRKGFRGVVWLACRLLSNPTMYRRSVGIWVVLATALAGCGSSATPSGKELHQLTPEERQIYCDQLAAQAESSGIDAAQLETTCRAAGISTAQAANPQTDADAQTACQTAYDTCKSTVSVTTTLTCDMASWLSPDCTATVDQYTACFVDLEASFLQTTLPACDTLTVAGLATTPDSPPQPAVPPSCLPYINHCPSVQGLSDAAQSFVDQYCALVAPCCSTQAGLTSDCAQAVTSAGQQAKYDATAGTACLAALMVQKSDANFCGGLAVIIGSSTPWAVIPACAAAFQSAGVTAAGQACNTDSDCAPGPNGGAICLTTPVPGDGVPPTFMKTCQLLTGKVGDACFGTYSDGGTEFFNSSLGGAICDQSQGVMCDAQFSTAVGSPVGTSLCVAGGAPGASCSSNYMCDPAAAYCNFAAGGICVTRLPLGATCTGTLFSECAGSAYCNDTSKKCTALGGAGAACSLSASPSDCLSGFCNGGTCTSPLWPLCQ
jgi:hypothetical protein